MKIYLDSADIEKIELYINEYGLDGFTCNPSICAKQKVDLKLLLNTGSKTTSFFQVIETSLEGMLKDAHKILAINPNAIIKIPVTKEGLRTIRNLSKKGVPVLATAIYSVSQAIMAMKSGAGYIAPYVNRISNTGSDGVAVVIEMLDIIRSQNLKCEIVAASFKNIHQVTQLIKAGVHSVTIPIEIFEKMIQSDLADSAVAKFNEDWFGTYGLRSFL